LTGNENKAWAEFKTPLSEEALLDFCHNIEQLFRINPYLEINKWEQLAPHSYFFDFVNHSQAPEFSLQTNMNIIDIANGLRIQYDNGIKSETTFICKRAPEGSKLVITEQYHSHDSKSNNNQLNKVDKSLTKWAEEIQNYLINWKRWSWFSPWQFYKQRIWLPMKPSSRRITYMLIWISIFEIVLIALGTLIYFLEFR